MRYDPVILLQRVSVLRYDCISKVQSQRIIPSAAVLTRSFWSPIMHVKSMKPMYEYTISLSAPEEGKSEVRT